MSALVIATTSLRCDRCLHTLGERAECSRVLDSQVGEHLAVHLDAGFLQAGDEPVVRQSAGAHGGVDAHDPQRAKVSLAYPTVAICIDEPFLDRLTGLSVQPAPPANVALGELHDLLSS